MKYIRFKIFLKEKRGFLASKLYPAVRGSYVTLWFWTSTFDDDVIAARLGCSAEQSAVAPAYRIFNVTGRFQEIPLSNYVIRRVTHFAEQRDWPVMTSPRRICQLSSPASPLDSLVKCYQYFLNSNFVMLLNYNAYLIFIFRDIVRLIRDAHFLYFKFSRQ